MFSFGPVLLEASARKILNRLHKTHGEPALAAAAEHPALMAVLDQHAAAVRDILELGVPGAAEIPAEVLLAGYARGLLDQVRDNNAPTHDAPVLDADALVRDAPARVRDAGATGRMNGVAPTDTRGWAAADWLQLRLAGVCLHAMHA